MTRLKIDPLSSERPAHAGRLLLIGLLGLVVLVAGCPKKEGPASPEKTPNVGSEPSEAPAKRGPERSGRAEEAKMAEKTVGDPAKAPDEPNKADEPKEAKKGLAISDIEVDCQTVCGYQFSCAAEALKAVGKPPVEGDQADAKNACKMACDAAINSKHPLAMRNYQASTACLDQKCGMEHTKCLTSLLMAAQ
ncbi:MAG: hypothetical protein ACI9OJ_001329 [Myxococcota bacterium]|jgi:hypothetical protein